MRPDFSIPDIPGKQNVTADFMSRKPTSGESSREEMLDEAQVLFVEEEIIDAKTIISETKKDPVLSRVLKFTLNDWPESTTDSSLRPFFAKRWELMVANDILLWHDCIVVPIFLRSVLLRELHSDHSGSVKMKRLAHRYIWWPNMDEELNETTKHCLACQEQAQGPSKTYATWSWPTGPWQRLQIDFEGPFLGK